MVGEWIFGFGHDSLVSLVGLCARAARADFLRCKVLSRSLAATQESARPTLDTLVSHSVRALHLVTVSVGALHRRAGASLFHGVGGDHYFDKPRSLGGGAHERESGKFAASLDEARSQRRAAAQPGRHGNRSAGKLNCAHPTTSSRSSPAIKRPWMAKSVKAKPPWTNPCSPANHCPSKNLPATNCMAGTLNVKWPPATARHRHRRSHRARAHHRRRRARANQPRGNPAPR